MLIALFVAMSDAHSFFEKNLKKVDPALPNQLFSAPIPSITQLTPYVKNQRTQSLLRFAVPSSTALGQNSEAQNPMSV